METRSIRPLRFVVHDAGGTRTLVPDAHDELTLGSGNTNSLILSAAGVAEHHARVLTRDGTYVLECVNPGGATFLNGKQVDDLCLFNPGDMITLGEAIVQVRSASDLGFSLSSIPVPPSAGHATRAGAEKDDAHADDAVEVELDASEHDTPAYEAPVHPRGDYPDGFTHDDDPDGQHDHDDPDGQHDDHACREGTGQVREAVPTPRFSLPSPTTDEPARLVVVSRPRPGRVLPLAGKNRFSIGRSRACDLRIPDRTVEREHAVIEHDRGEYVIYTTRPDSMLVNGAVLQQDALFNGDIVTLGSVQLQFVGAGIPYRFDGGAIPRGPVSSIPARRRSRLPWLLVAVLGGGATAYLSQDAALQETLTGPVEGVEQAGLAALPPTPDDPLKACQVALDKGDHTVAKTQAQLALAKAPNDPQTRACLDAAKQGLKDDETFQLGMRLQDANDGRACEIFGRLSEHSRLRQHEQVTETCGRVAQAHLATAGAAIGHAPEQALEAATRVTQMPLVSEAHRASAMALQEAAKAVLEGTDLPEHGGDPTADAADGDVHDSELEPGSEEESADAEQRAQPAAEPGPKGEPQAAKHTTKHTTKPKPTRRRTARAPRKRVTRPRTHKRANGGRESAMDKAAECLARGDNRCTIDVLRRTARTEREVALLVETYLAVGNRKAASEQMERYVQSFPRGANTRRYRNSLAAEPGETEDSDP